MEVGRRSYNLLSDTVRDIFPHELRKAMKNRIADLAPNIRTQDVSFHLGVVRTLLRCVVVYYSFGLYMTACSAYIMNTINFTVSTTLIVIRIEITWYILRLS
jgi:hypothetical protein